MSYAIGSVLSIGSGATLEQVIVLSDERVATKLFAGKPVVQRDILSLSDWLVLAEGQEITVPVNKTSISNPMSDPPGREPTVYAVGTLIRWIKDDQNKRVALVMNDRILQVKEVIAGEITMHNPICVKRVAFKDFAEWKASLPEGGSISAEAIKPSAPTIEEKAKAPILATTDAGYIAELSERYLVRSRIYHQPSINQSIEYTRTMLKSAIQQVALNTSMDSRHIDRLISSIGGVGRYAKWLKRLLFDARDKGAEELNAATFRFKNYYKQKLFAYKNGLKYEICTNKNGIIALAPSPEGTKYRENALAGKSFAELGIEMKEDGKPRLEVSYYRKRIEL